MLRPRPTRIGAALLIVAAAVATTMPPLATGAAAAVGQLSCGKWHLVPTAAGIPEAAFFAGAQVSSNDIWAGGRQGNDGLLEHWDGHSWTESAAPFPTGAGGTSISGLAAISSDDVWAVGSSDGLPGQPFILHFDGSAWSLVPSPAPASGTRVALAAVSASGPGDVWAAGYVLDTSNDQQYRWNNLVEHWDGQAWSVVDAPSLVPDSDTLSAVAAIAPNDVWVVGGNGLTAHWNGTVWSVVSNPFGRESLLAVSGSSSSNVWAGGYPDPLDQGTAAVGRFDGTAWSLESIRPGYTAVQSVAAASPTDVWASGLGDLAAHWTGQAWQNASAPPGPGRYGGRYGTPYLDSILHPAPADVWGLGFSAAGSGDLPRALHLCPLRILDSGLASTARLTIPEGASISWFVPSSETASHAVTDLTGLGLYGSGPISAGSWFSQVYPAAGIYPYADSSGSSSSIAVPVKVGQHALRNGSMEIGVRWAMAGPPSGYASDIQVRPPSASTFQSWRTESAITSAPYTPSGPGTYSFRARLRSLNGGGASEWSPVASVTVAA